MTDFEPIYAALFAVSAGLLGFNTARRRVVHWSDLNEADFPGLFQGMGNEVNLNPKRGQPAKWELTPKQYLYVHAGNDTTVDPSTLLNPMLGLLRTAFPQADQAVAGGKALRLQTLGDLVSHCFIDRIETWEGTLGPIEAAVIHFNILATGV